MEDYGLAKEILESMGFYVDLRPVKEKERKEGEEEEDHEGQVIMVVRKKSYKRRCVHEQS